MIMFCETIDTEIGVDLIERMKKVYGCHRTMVNHCDGKRMHEMLKLKSICYVKYRIR